MYIQNISKTTSMEEDFMVVGELKLPLLDKMSVVFVLARLCGGVMVVP